MTASHHTSVCVQEAKYGVLWTLPRACWITFFVLMLIYITHTGGFLWEKTLSGAGGLMRRHYIFMTVAW